MIIINMLYIYLIYSAQNINSRCTVQSNTILNKNNQVASLEQYPFHTFFRTNGDKQITQKKQRRCSLLGTKHIYRNQKVHPLQQLHSKKCQDPTALLPLATLFSLVQQTLPTSLCPNYRNSTLLTCKKHRGHLIPLFLLTYQQKT